MLSQAKRDHDPHNAKDTHQTWDFLSLASGHTSLDAGNSSVSLKILIVPANARDKSRVQDVAQYTSLPTVIKAHFPSPLIKLNRTQTLHQALLLALLNRRTSQSRPGNVRSQMKCECPTRVSVR
jgi:hypothetical protein